MTVVKKREGFRSVRRTVQLFQLGAKLWDGTLERRDRELFRRRRGRWRVEKING